MSWFRLSSLVFAFWAVVFVVFPRFTNESAGIGYGGSTHAEDWTQLVGLLSLGFAVLLSDVLRHVPAKWTVAAEESSVGRPMTVLTAWGCAGPPPNTPMKLAAPFVDKEVIDL